MLHVSSGVQKCMTKTSSGSKLLVEPGELPAGKHEILHEIIGVAGIVFERRELLHRG